MKSLYEEFVEIAKQDEIRQRREKQDSKENTRKNKTIIHHMPCPITGKPYSKEEIEEPTVQDLRRTLGLDK